MSYILHYAKFFSWTDTKALSKLTFPDHENFSCANEAYSDLTSWIFDAVQGAKSAQIPRFFWPVFSCIRTEYRKIRTRKTPYLDTFLAVVNKVASTKATGVKNNRNEWFDGEITVKIVAPDKLFRKFWKSKLSVDEILYKEARDTVQALIKNK